MKKTIPILLTIFLFNSIAFAQNCTLFEKGYQIPSVYMSYSPAVTSTKGWYKMKPEKQAVLIDEYNKNVLSGIEPAFSTSSIDMYIKDVERVNGFEKVTAAMMASGVEYTFNSFCVDGINYSYRTIGPVYYVSNGDTVGAGFNGAQVIPNDLKVGDILSPYEDFSNLVTSTSSYTDKQTVLAGYRQVETIEKNATYLNKETFKYETGDWKVTKYEQVFKEMDVKVMQNTSLNSHTIHYVNAIVDTVIDVQLNDKPYKAYIIESELWIQAAFETTFAADNAKWEKIHQNFSNKIQNKAEKNLIKLKFLNEDGYYVTYLTDWFIPGYGIVKTITYGSDGFISNIVKWTNLK
jgi:hypothetical protein